MNLTVIARPHRDGSETICACGYPSFRLSREQIGIFHQAFEAVGLELFEAIQTSPPEAYLLGFEAAFRLLTQQNLEFRDQKSRPVSEANEQQSPAQSCQSRPCAQLSSEFGGWASSRVVSPAPLSSRSPVSGCQTDTVSEGVGVGNGLDAGEAL